MYRGGYSAPCPILGNFSLPWIGLSVYMHIKHLFFTLTFVSKLSTTHFYVKLSKNLSFSAQNLKQKIFGVEMFEDSPPIWGARSVASYFH